MPFVHNKTQQEFNLRIGRSIGPDETLEVSDAEAAELAGHPLLDSPESHNNEGEGESE